LANLIVNLEPHYAMIRRIMDPAVMLGVRGDCILSVNQQLE